MDQMTLNDSGMTLNDYQMTLNDSRMTFTVASSNDFDEICQFTNDHFRVTDPLSVAVDLTEEDAIAGGLMNSVQENLPQGLSYLARDKDDHIAGMCITRIFDRPVPNESDQEDVFHWRDQMPWKCRAIVDIADALEKELWPRVPENVNRLAHIRIVCVREDAQRIGLATELLNYSMKKAIDQGCQAAFAKAVARKSLMMFKKQGYVSLFEIEYSQWLNDQGQPIFVCKDGSDRAVLVYKPLL